jgi:hypothetical protein
MRKVMPRAFRVMYALGLCSLTACQPPGSATSSMPMAEQALVLTPVPTVPAAESRNFKYPAEERHTVPLLPDYPRPLKVPVVTDRQATSNIFDVPEREIVFFTNDTPPEVHTWYRDQLPQYGWEYPRVYLNGRLLSMLNEEACPLYFVDITTSQQRTGTTRIHLVLTPSACQDGPYDELLP